MHKSRNERCKCSSLVRKLATVAMAVVATLVMKSACYADTIDQQIYGESSLSSEPNDAIVLGSALERLQSKALSLIGVRYRYGGSTPQAGFDCSGFVRYVFHHATKLYVGRTAESMATEGSWVQRAELRAGDLVFFNTLGKTYSHVGIYLGNGRFVHSPSQGGRVRLDELNNAYWQARYSGARRLIL
ncbi:C40 family peptidase [Burkholderia ubonensis]|uniref:C40 family peptidase n=1 Tax=Burkholderia ubonensis TaxID=101571 RepID=UPI0012FBFC05|nr:C40 family peptidase [Burkholderia ubonensis]